MRSSTSNPVLVNDELRLKLRRVINVEVDDQLIDLLAYIVLHEPTTLYRISKNTKYAVSTVYKKAKKMMHYGLIKPHIRRNEGVMHKRATYETTVAGLLLCLAYGCVVDDVVLGKLCYKWQLRNYCYQGLLSLIHVLPVLPELDYRILEEPRALMILILNNIDRLRSMLGNDLFKEVINTAVYYLMSRLFVDGQIVTKSSLLVGNENFVVNLSLDGRVYVYVCKLCNKQCVGTYLSLNNQCYLLHEIRSIKLAVNA